MKCENKSKKSAVPKSCSPNVRPSAVCMTKCSLPPRKCWMQNRQFFNCYGQYSIQSEAAAMQNGYSLMHGKALAASVGGGNSFSVIGVSGLGKSTALQRVLSLFPQVIEHTSYHGQNFYCHQIPYLVVQTPHDASIKALILDIYLQIDSLVETSYQKDALSRRLSILLHRCTHSI